MAEADSTERLALHSFQALHSLEEEMEALKAQQRSQTTGRKDDSAQLREEISRSVCIPFTGLKYW